MLRKPTAPQIVKDYPALTGSAALALVDYVLAYLVTHHVIGSMHVGTVEQTVVPIVAAGLTQLAGVVLHLVVSPAAKVKDLLERHSAGQLNDADFGRLAQFILEQFGAADDGTAELPAHDLGDSPVPDGMTAGAPTVSEAPPADA